MTVELPERNREAIATIVKAELDRDVAAHYEDFDVHALSLMEERMEK